MYAFLDYACLVCILVLSSETALTNPEMVSVMYVSSTIQERESPAYYKWAMDVDRTALANVKHDKTCRDIRACARYISVRACYTPK